MLVLHATPGVERRRVVEVAHLEVGGERRHDHSPAGPHRVDHLAQRQHVLVDGTARPPEQTEPALAQGERHVEAARLDREPARVGVHEGATRRRSKRDKGPREVDPHDITTCFGERSGVTARPTADVEHTRARSQAEDVGQERDLLGGALRERVTEVGRPEMVGHRLEPMGLPAAHGAPLD